MKYLKFSVRREIVLNYFCTKMSCSFRISIW